MIRTSGHATGFLAAILMSFVMNSAHAQSEQATEPVEVAPATEAEAAPAASATPVYSGGCNDGSYGGCSDCKDCKHSWKFWKWFGHHSGCGDSCGGCNDCTKCRDCKLGCRLGCFNRGCRQCKILGHSCERCRMNNCHGTLFGKLHSQFGNCGPRGCGGKGCPPFGCYQMVYPVNPDYCDPRGSVPYAAQGYGVPMAVPTAPIVRHTYNYSWGVPASRLTPISNHSPWRAPQQTNYPPYGYANPYGYGNYGYPHGSAGCPHCQAQATPMTPVPDKTVPESK